MKIRVLQEHIQRGIPCTMSRCPIALAIREQSMTNLGMYEIEVSGDGISIGTNTFGIPKEAVEFIEQYDNKEDVQPIEFEIWPL